YEAVQRDDEPALGSGHRAVRVRLPAGQLRARADGRRARQGRSQHADRSVGSGFSRTSIPLAIQNQSDRLSALFLEQRIHEESTVARHHVGGAGEVLHRAADARREQGGRRRRFDGAVRKCAHRDGHETVIESDIKQLTAISAPTGLSPAIARDSYLAVGLWKRLNIYFHLT